MTRPRVVIPWPAEAAPRAALESLLDGDLRAGPLDLVLVVPEGVRAAEPRVAPEQLGAGLEEARAAGRGRCLVASQGGAEALARRLLGEGRVDALVLASPPAGQVPCLRVREGIRVGDPWPQLGLEQLPGGADADRLADALRQAGVLLRQLGVTRPRLALCELEGAPAVAAGARAADGQELDVLGPLPPEQAARQRCDAVVGLSRGEVALLLELLGSGPVTVFPLDAAHPVAWPADPGATPLLLAISRAADLAPRPLAAEREQARRGKVSVTARSGRAAATRPTGDRCPYCRRPLREGALPAPPARCVTCGTGHHRDCLAEHGHCTVLGCPGTEVERLGVRFAVERLGAEQVQQHPFERLEGDTGSGPSLLRVEAPVDDPDARTAGRPWLSLELATPRVRRGELVEGYVVVASPRPCAIRGGLLRVRSTLTTQRVDARGTRALPRPQSILAREALLAGQTPAGALGRLQDGMVALFGSSNRLQLPAGVRRWPFAFRLGSDHPPSVTNRHKDVEESVTTRVEVVLDTETASATLDVA